MASAVVSDNFETSSGAVPELGGADRQNQWCKAWVNFNGTGTPSIRASHNVSSITDISTGQWRINFTTAMDNANYSYTEGGHFSDNSNNGMFHGFNATPTTTSLEVRCWRLNVGWYDTSQYSVQVFSN